MTFPVLRHDLLHSFATEESFIAIAAYDQKIPIGLALAAIRDDDTAALLSIYVEPAYRQMGVGTALVNRIEIEVLAHNSTSVDLTYTSGKPTTLALERLLQSCGWSAPQPQMLVCKGKAAKLLQAPWVHRCRQLPTSFSLVPWVEITLLERQEIQRQQEIQPWIPADLVPFQHEQDLEPLNSLALRYQGQVVGWVINHRLKPDTIRYTCSFVREDLQRMGRLVALYVEAANRQLQAGVTKGIWTTPFRYPRMVNFVQRHWSPFLDSIAETRFAAKSL